MPDRLFAEAQLAQFYDAFCPRSERQDFDFYLPLVMAAGSVLDVGCGTGSLLHEARDEGHHGRLCGLDPASGMLAQAHRRTDIEWVLGDLRSTTIEGEFELVVMTGHAFQALVSDDDIRVALAAIRAALSPAGTFAFETRNPAARVWEQWADSGPVEAFLASGQAVRMTRWIEVPFDGDTLSFRHSFTSDFWEDPEISRSTLRFVDNRRLMSFLTEAGFVVEHQFGDWHQCPLTGDHAEIITLAGRA